MKTLATIEGCDWNQFDDLHIKVEGARARVCTDGKGPHHGDKNAQNETAYWPPLNADVDDYVVIPMCIRKPSKGVVVGAQAVVYDTKTGNQYNSVVGDTGPNDRTGEFSRSLIIKMGLNGDPNKGGWNKPRFTITIYPNVPALVNGKQYKLIPA